MCRQSREILCKLLNLVDLKTCLCCSMWPLISFLAVQERHGVDCVAFATCLSYPVQYKLVDLLFSVEPIAPRSTIAPEHITLSPLCALKDIYIFAYQLDTGQLRFSDPVPTPESSTRS